MKNGTTYFYKLKTRYTSRKILDIMMYEPNRFQFNSNKKKLIISITMLQANKTKIRVRAYARKN